MEMYSDSHWLPEHMYVKLLIVDTLRLGRNTFRGSSKTPRSGRLGFVFLEIHPAITLCTNNRITLCSYSVQLSTTLC